LFDRGLFTAVLNLEKNLVVAISVLVSDESVVAIKAIVTVGTLTLAIVTTTTSCPFVNLPPTASGGRRLAVGFYKLCKFGGRCSWRLVFWQWAFLVLGVLAVGIFAGLVKSRSVPQCY
jgi:hypothetical protein